MYVLVKITVLFTLVLALALLVERFLEILKTVLDLMDDRFNNKEVWTKRAIKVKNRLESKLGVFEYVAPQKAAVLFERFQHMLLGTQDGYTGTVPVISGDLLRASWIKLMCKIVGICLGIGLAFWMNIDLVKIWPDAAGIKKISADILPESVRILLSGIAIGLGSGPAHKIIRSIEAKKKKKEGGNHG